ncbi:MAG: ABC transporter permease [Chloroflexota bacterium]|nr:ABC transporter permease [Chloroflexota bacterium]
MTTLPQTTFSSRRGLMAYLGDLWRYRDLLYNLTVRDLKVRYKNSVLGILWSLLNPLLMMLVFTFAFTVMIPQNIPHFSVFLLAGLLPWNFFSGTVISAANQIVANGHLIKKVYFPREALPISTVLSNSVNFLLSLIPLALFLILSGIGFTEHLLWLPLIFAIQLLLLLGLSLILSALTVFYRDMVMVLDVAILGLFFLSPVFYPMELIQREATIMGIVVPVERLVRWLNPMASIVDSYRTVVYGVLKYPPDQAPIYYSPAEPEIYFLLRTGLTALIIFLIGAWFFRRVSSTFGEEV